MAAVLAIVLAGIVVAIVTRGGDESTTTAGSDTTAATESDSENGSDGSGGDENGSGGSDSDTEDADSTTTTGSSTTTSRASQDMLGKCTDRDDFAIGGDIRTMSCSDPEAYYEMFDKAPGNDPNRCLDIQGGENVLRDNAGTWYCMGRNGFDRANAINDAKVGDCIGFDDPGQYQEPKKVRCGSGESYQIIGVLPRSSGPHQGDDTQECIDAGYADAAMIYSFGYAGGEIASEVGAYNTYCLV